MRAADRFPFCLTTHLMPTLGFCRRLHERRKLEGVAAVLHPEDGKQETIHEDQDSTPDNNSELLHLGVSSPRSLDG